jgi:hypothetical protein
VGFRAEWGQPAVSSAPDMDLTLHRRLLLPLALWGVAAWVRVRDVDAVMMLADSVGPYWVAAAHWVGAGHTPLYGWGMSPPYSLALGVGDSLAGAAMVLLVLHALVAPLVYGLVRAVRPERWMAATAAGLLLALDPGLVDTAISGAKGYLAAVWLGVGVWALVGGKGNLSAALGGGALAMAGMNHPLALSGLVFLGLRDLRKRDGQLAAVVALGLVGPHVLGLLGQPLTASGGAQGAPGEVFSSFLLQGGRCAALVLVAPLIGLTCRRTRRLAVATLCMAVLLLGGGIWLGYLRDHHLRLLAVPALGCLAALPARWGWLALLALEIPAVRSPPADHPHRPGTVGLATRIARDIDELGLDRPLVVDGVWVSGTPAADPSAVMLDLWLMGASPDSLAPGGTTALVVSVDRPQQNAVTAALAGWQGTRRAVGDTHFVVTEGAKDFAQALCLVEPRFGGAWDAMAVLHPALTVDQVRHWEPDCGQGGVTPAAPLENQPEFLDLVGPQVGDGDLVGLDSNPALRRLEVRGTRVTDAGLAALAGLTALEKLKLSDNMLQGDGISLLAPLQALRWFDLEGERITDSAIPGILQLQGIIRLHLGNTSVSNEGLSRLSGLPRLNRLYMTGPRIDDQTLESLSGLRLRVLDLTGTDVNGPGLSHLASKDGLLELYLRGTPMDDRGLETLGAFTKLEVLDLAGTRITDAGLVHLQHHWALKALYLGDTAVSPGARGRMEASRTILKVYEGPPVHLGPAR